MSAQTRFPGAPVWGWRPSCAVCVLLGFRAEAVTLISGHPVCMDHAAGLAGESAAYGSTGLLRATRQAEKDLGRDSGHLASGAPGAHTRDVGPDGSPTTKEPQ